MLRPASLRRSNQEGDGFSVATPQSTNRNQSWYRKLCRTENPALYREEEEGQEETLQTPSPQRLQLQMLLQREYQQRQELQKNCRQDWWQRKSGPSPGVQSHAGSFHTPTPVQRVYPAAPPFYLDGSYHQHTPRPGPREQPLNSPLSTTYLQQASADGPRRNVNNLEQILRVCPDQDKRLEEELMLKAAHVIKHDTEKRMREAQREYTMPAPNEQDSIQRKILQLLTEYEMAEKYRQASQTPRTPRPPPSQTPDLQHKIAKLLQAYQQVPTHQLPATYQTRQDQVATYNNMLQAYRQGNLEQSYQQAKLLLHQLLIKEPTTLIPKEPSASQVSFAPGFYPPHQAYYPQQTPPQYGASGMQPVFRTPYPPRPPVRIRRDPRLNQSTQQYQARDLDITPRLNQSTYQVSEHDISQERLYQTGNGRKPRNGLLNSTAHDEYSFEDENGNILPKQDRKRQFEHPGKDDPPTTPAPKKDVRPSPGQQQGQKSADPGSAPARSSSAGRRQAESREGVTRPGTDLLTHDWEQLQQRSQYLCRGRRVHPHQQTEEGDQKMRKVSEETRKGPNVSSTVKRHKKTTTSDQTKRTNDDGQSPGKSSASQAEAQAKKTSASYQKEEEDQGEKTPKLSSVLSTETQDQKQLSESFDKSAYVQNQTKIPSTESLHARKSSEVQVREKTTGPKPVQATEPDIKVTAAEPHPPRDSQEESKPLKDPQQAHCDPQQPPRDSQPSLGTQRSSRNSHQFTRGHQQLPPQNHRQISESRQRQSRNKGESRGDAKSPSGTALKPGNARSPGSTAPKSSDADPQGGSSLSTFSDPKSATSKPASGAPSEKAVNKKSPGSTSSLSSNRPKPAAAKSPSGQVKKAETSPPTFRPRRRGTRRRPAQRDTPGCQSEDLSPRSQPQSRDRNRHQEPQQSRRSSSPRRWQDRRRAWSPTARRRPHQTDWDDTSAGPAKKIRAVGQQGGNRSLEVNARREHQHERSENRKEKHASEGPLKKSPRPEPLRTAGKTSPQKTETPKGSGRRSAMPNDKASQKGRSAQDEQRMSGVAGSQTDEKRLDMRSAVTDRPASKPDTPEAHRVDNGTYESPKDTRHESARDMSCDDPSGHILSTHASGDEPSLTTGKLEPGANNSSDDLTEKCEASECEEHAAPKHGATDAPPCSRKGAQCSDESGAGSGDGAGEKHDVHSHASASVATGETSEAQLQTRDSVINGELQTRACLPEDGEEEKSEDKAKHAGEEVLESQNKHQDAEEAKPEVQTEHEDAVNPTPEAQAEHEDAANPPPEAQAEHQDAVDTPEAQAEHQDAVNPTPEAKAEHQDPVNPTPEAQAEHEDPVNPTPEAQAEHQDPVNPTPEAQAEHQDAINPTPEAQAEHQDVVNPTPEAQIEHQDAINPTPEAQAEHQVAVKPTPEAQAEHQDAVKPTPEAQAEHEDAVDPTPEAQAEHEDAVNPTPEAWAEHEDAVVPTPEAQAEHEDAVNPTPEAQTEHQDTEDEKAEAGTKPQDSTEEMLEGQTGNDDAVDQNPETRTGHHHAVAEKSELPSELGDAGLGHPPTYGPRDRVVEEPVTRLEHVLAVLAGMKSVVEADEETEANDFTDVHVLSSRMSEREGSAGTGAASSVEPEDMSVDDERSGEDSAADASLTSSLAADQDGRPPTTSEELQQQQQHKPGENPEQHQSSPDPEAVDKSTDLETREEPDKNPDPEVPDKNPEQRQSSPTAETLDSGAHLETREEPEEPGENPKQHQSFPDPEAADKSTDLETREELEEHVENPKQLQSSPKAETLDSGADLATQEEPEEPDENPKQHQSFPDPEAVDKSTDLETREEPDKNPKQRQSSPKAETLDSGADLATQEEPEEPDENPKQHQSFPDPEAVDKSTDLETREEPDKNPKQRQSSPKAETLDSGAHLETREEPEEPDENRERCEPSSPGAEHKTAFTHEVAQPERTQRDGTVKAEPRSEPLYTKPADETGEDGEYAPVVHDAAAAHPLKTGCSGRAYAVADTGSLATNKTTETDHKDVAEAAKQCEMTRGEKMEAAHDTVLLQIQTSDGDDDADADVAVGEPAAPDVSAKTKPAAAASGTCSYRGTPRLFPDSPAVECSKAVTTDLIDPAVDGPTATEMASLDAVEECGKGTISSCALHEVPSKDATDSPALTAQQLVGNPEEDTAGRAVAEENGTELERNLNNNVIDQNDLAASGKSESENNTSKTEMTREQSVGGEGVPEDTGDEREDDDVAEKVLSTQEGTPGGLAGTERLGKEETAGESASCQNACCRLRPTLDRRPTDGDVTVGKVLVDRLTVNGII